MSVVCRRETEAERAAPEAAPRRRIILLSGEWSAPGTVFALEATVFTGESGHAEGDFFFINVDTPWAPADQVGTELVSGEAEPTRLELQGYKVDPTFVLDHYVIRLLGDAHGGAFEGESRAFGEWDGRLRGTYRVVEQSA